MKLREMLIHCSATEEQFKQADMSGITDALTLPRGVSALLAHREGKIKACKVISEMATIFLVVLPDAVLDKKLQPDQQSCFSDVEARMAVFKALNPPAPAPVPVPAPLPGESSLPMLANAPTCPECGHVTVRKGAMYECLNCGKLLGCS